LSAFLGPISRLAPGAVPDVKIETPLSDALTFVLMAFLLLLIPAAWFGESAPWFMILVVVSILVLWLLTWIAAKQKPTNVQFGDLRTFRELATVIADHTSTEQKIAVER
jgi:4-hydroxybenzoate polyprenyltransferase